MNVKAVSAGDDYTCILTTAGGVRCWGGNAYGQLGDGTKTDRLTPGTDLLTGVQAIAAGAQHACALTMTGGVKCWGSNVNNQLGDGTTINHAAPVDVLTPGGVLTGVRAISAGFQHNCVLTTDGGTRCWGFNNNGQLGDGTMTNRSAAADTTLLAGVQAIAPGVYHTCALSSVGPECWGLNLLGQLGDGTMTDRSTPASVLTPTGLLGDVRVISAGGNHTCAIMATTAGVRCWGNNDGGQLGDGTTTSRLTAPDVDGLVGAQAVVTGYYHTCALTLAGGVRCWGYNADGEIGEGTTSNRSVPSASDILTGVRGIAAGGFHNCALTAAGVQCWGKNASGQLGDGTTGNRSSPTSGLRICP